MTARSSWFTGLTGETRGGLCDKLEVVELSSGDLNGLAPHEECLCLFLGIGESVCPECV